MFYIGRHFLPRKLTTVTAGQPFLVKSFIGSAFSTPSVNLGTHSWKQRNFHLRYNVWFNTNGRRKQFSATQMSASAASQISSDPQLTFFSLIEQTFWPFFSIDFHEKVTERINLKAY